jgi:DNA-binding MarR family transcriptional regulator
MLPISRIAVISLTWSRRLQRQLLPHGLTLKQLHVLQELTRKEVLSPSQIAEMLYAYRPTATVIIRNLRKNGWVAKERDPENRRRFRVVITARGRQKVQEVRRSGFRGNPSLKLEAVFSPEELKQLDSYLQRLQRHLEETG